MKEKILKILKELRDDIDYEKCDKLIDDGCFGSFEILQIITEIEEEFDIVIPPAEINVENFNSLNSLCEMIYRI